MDDDLKPYVTAIDHIGIAVPDLEVAIDFYVKSLGLRVTHTEVNEEQGVREAMLHAPDDDGTGTAIQLLAPLRSNSVVAKFLDKRGPGVQQVAYRVSDVDITAKALRSNSLHVLYQEPKRGTSNSRVNFVHPKDAGGVLIELVEPAR